MTTRDEALADLIREMAHAQRLVERLIREQPRNPTAINLHLALEHARADLVLLRHHCRRERVHGVHIKGARDWAKIRRRQRERIKRETAARLRIDPATLPELRLDLLK